MNFDLWWELTWAPKYGSLPYKQVVALRELVRTGWNAAIEDMKKPELGTGEEPQ